MKYCIIKFKDTTKTLFIPLKVFAKKSNSTTSPSIAIFFKLLTVSVYKIKKKQGVKNNLTTFENDIKKSNMLRVNNGNLQNSLVTKASPKKL